MENYIHVKIFILWTLVISTLVNEWAKILSPSPNPTQMCNLFLMGRTNKPSIHRNVFQTFLLFVLFKEKKKLVWTWILKANELLSVSKIITKFYKIQIKINFFQSYWVKPGGKNNSTMTIFSPSLSLSLKLNPSSSSKLLLLFFALIKLISTSR